MQSSFTTIAPAIVRRFNFRRTERQVPRTALKHRAAANIATTSSSKLGYVVVPLFLSTCTFEQFFFFFYIRTSLRILVFLHSLFIFIIQALRIKISCYPFWYVCDHNKSVQKRPSNIYYKINALTYK